MCCHWLIHHSRETLTSTVGAAQTVALATLQAQACVVEQNLGTIGEGELAVAQVLTLLLLLSGGVGGTHGVVLSLQEWKTWLCCS
jgi:hypothetical protein